MHTVISAFQNTKTAERAISRLVEANFQKDRIQLRHKGDEHCAERSVLSSMGHFFASLLGQDTPALEEAEYYAEAVRRGHPLLVVDAQTYEEAERAAGLLQQLGAIDIHERTSEWGDSGFSELGHQAVRVISRR